MDRQIAIDRITETENLTDGLEDDDANWLLDWGVAHVDGLVTGIKDEDAAGEKLNQLMAVMRTLNQIAADRVAKPPDALAGDIRTFLERYQQAFGAPKAGAPTAAPTPATDAKTAPTASQAPSTSFTPSTPSTPSIAPPTGPKDGQDSGASPTTTPPATKADRDQPKQSQAANTPSASSNATPPANAMTQADQASDQAMQAASKIAGMTPREAMRYLLSLAEAGAPVAS